MEQKTLELDFAIVGRNRDRDRDRDRDADRSVDGGILAAVPGNGVGVFDL